MLNMLNNFIMVTLDFKQEIKKWREKYKGERNTIQNKFSGTIIILN